MSNSKRSKALSTSVMALVFACSTAAFAENTAIKKSTVQTVHERKVTVLAENEKLQVMDVLYQPGDTGGPSSKDGLVVYHLSPGTIEHIYADGSKTVVTYQTGQTMIIDEKRPYSTKNIGKTAVHEIVVQLK